MVIAVNTNFKKLLEAKRKYYLGYTVVSVFRRNRPREGHSYYMSESERVLLPTIPIHLSGFTGSGGDPELTRSSIGDVFV